MNNPEYINIVQPTRPRHDEETGKVILFRTRPKWQRKMIKIHTFATQICAMRLYRAAHRGEVPQQVAISDLHQWVAPDNAFSKVTLGYVVVNSVSYEPRKLVANQSVLKATSSYAFLDPKVRDLKYGLEWMICIFLRRFLDQFNEQSLRINSREMMLEELNELADMSEDQYKNDIETDIAEFQLPTIEWNSNAESNNWFFREEMPPSPIKQSPKPERTPPKDLSGPPKIEKRILKKPEPKP